MAKFLFVLTRGPEDPTCRHWSHPHRPGGGVEGFSLL